MSTFEWVIDHDFEPLIGPPKPLGCPAGWLSHQWTLSIDEGSIAIIPRDHDCRLCTDGMADLESDFIGGEIPVDLILHNDRSYDGDYDWWWEVTAPPHIPGD